MELKSPNTFWWMKQKVEEPHITSTPRTDGDLDNSNVSSSLADFLEKERAVQTPKDDDTDIGSIIEEINRLAAQSPLGPYQKGDEARSFEDIMREAEKVYMESSKSFEQLSMHSLTSNISFSLSDSTPTPKSTSPLPLDPQIKEKSRSQSYTSDSFETGKGSESHPSPDLSQLPDESKSLPQHSYDPHKYSSNSDGGHADSRISPRINLEKVYVNSTEEQVQVCVNDEVVEEKSVKVSPGGGNGKDMITITKLEEENRHLTDDLAAIKMQLQATSDLLATARVSTVKSPEGGIELSQTLEQLKDTRERNTALELQLDNLNKSHQFLRNTYDDLLDANKSLEKRMIESETMLVQCRTELVHLQAEGQKLRDNETNLLRQLDVERTCAKTWKSQNEKDTLAIQDLTRQVKEMERIIARKHPDSVAALIVAANSDKDSTAAAGTTRKLLEDRIRTLESQVSNRDRDSSRVFLEVQEKFTEMKAKYESHIEDLELHVNDLKDQLKRQRQDKFDIYTQTTFIHDEVPGKDSRDIAVQTDKEKRTATKVGVKEETHLLATIRGLQTDLLNKEKSLMRVNKDLEEAKRTNGRLQKEREGSLKSLPKKTTPQLKISASSMESLHEELESVRRERDRIRAQLCRLEDDYQVLKSKRLFDLNALQEVHENEIGTYVRSIKPLSDQLEAQQITIRSLQEQLLETRRQLELILAERDQLNEQLNNFKSNYSNDNEKIDGSTGCQRCSMRQKQLISYKEELDRLLATLQTLT